MVVLLPFAFLSGILTILSPCILPVLPVVLSGSVGGKARPYGVILGFVASFSLFTLALTAIVDRLGIPDDSFRIVAVVFMSIFGLIMIVPKLRDGFEIFISRFAGKGTVRGERRGFTGGVFIGASLGLVWTPCVGPIMASIISLAFTQQVEGGAVFIILAYSLGTAIPMFAVMIGGRELLKKIPRKNPALTQRIFGGLMILVALSIGFGWDRRFQTVVLEAFPGYGTGLTSFENLDRVRKEIDTREGKIFENSPLSFDNPPSRGRLGDYGPAPEIVTQGMWLNTDGEGYTMADLKGKVVLLDFWTYSCINCVRTVPHIRSWWEAYEDQGLVVIGVHTPEFAFERNPENLRAAMDDLGVTWPVIQDNRYAQWRAYGNRYWPAHYFIDAEGRIRYFQFGEGDYDVAENVIRKLLKEANGEVSGRARGTDEAKIQSNTPETYLGYSRTDGFASEQAAMPELPVSYTPVKVPDNGEWTLDGTWTFSKDFVSFGPAASKEESGVLELGFEAKNVFLVVEPFGNGGRIEVRVDGELSEDTPDLRDGILTPDTSRVYQLAGLPREGRHILNLKVTGELRLYAFTFG